MTTLSFPFGHTTSLSCPNSKRAVLGPNRLEPPCQARLQRAPPLPSFLPFPPIASVTPVSTVPYTRCTQFVAVRRPRPRAVADPRGLLPSARRGLAARPPQLVHPTACSPYPPMPPAALPLPSLIIPRKAQRRWMLGAQSRGCSGSVCRAKRVVGCHAACRARAWRMCPLWAVHLAGTHHQGSGSMEARNRREVEAIR